MRTIMTVNRPKIKAIRKNPKADAPFGSGILASHPYAGRMPYTSDDASWWAQQGLADDEPTDAEWDAMASERAMEDAYLAAVGAGTVCSACGMRPEPDEAPLTAGLCDRCSDATGEDIDRGHCWACGSLAWLEDDGCCVACSLRLSDASHSGNHGY